MEEQEKPRFEFRSFGQDFENASKRMARLSSPVPEKYWERTSDEIYIISATSNTCNAKIRDTKIDIKMLRQVTEGFEQWAPLMKSIFPMHTAALQNEIFPALEVLVTGLTKTNYYYTEFMDIIRLQPELKTVAVHKQRFAYMINNTICETGIILINGARVSTISVESSDIEALKDTVRNIGLSGVENINYLQAIKRITGMINQPLAN